MGIFVGCERSEGTESSRSEYQDIRWQGTRVSVNQDLVIWFADILSLIF